MKCSIQTTNLRKNRNQLQFLFFFFFKLCISLVHFWLLQSLIHPTSTLTPGSILYFPAIWTVFTLLRRKLNLFMNKENPLTIFPSCPYSYFLSSYFLKKIIVPSGDLTQSSLWPLLMSDNFFIYHFLVLPFFFLKSEVTIFPLSFHLLFIKALRNSTKVHIWWIRTVAIAPKCLFRKQKVTILQIKWTIAKLRSETNSKGT